MHIVHRAVKTTMKKIEPKFGGPLKLAALCGRIVRIVLRPALYVGLDFTFHITFVSHQYVKTSTVILTHTS